MVLLQGLLTAQSGGGSSSAFGLFIIPRLSRSWAVLAGRFWVFLQSECLPHRLGGFLLGLRFIFAFFNLFYFCQLLIPDLLTDDVIIRAGLQAISQFFSSNNCWRALAREQPILSKLARLSQDLDGCNIGHQPQSKNVYWSNFGPKFFGDGQQASNSGTSCWLLRLKLTRVKLYSSFCVRNRRLLVLWNF